MHHNFFEQWNDFHKQGLQPLLQFNAQWANATAHASERILRQCLSSASELANLNMSYAPKLANAKNLENAVALYSEWFRNYSGKCAEQAHELLDTYLGCYADLTKRASQNINHFTDLSTQQSKAAEQK